MKVKDSELKDFIREFARRNYQTNEQRLLSVLKAKFYGRENPKQLLYRCEHLELIRTNNEQITIL